MDILLWIYYYKYIIMDILLLLIYYYYGYIIMDILLLWIYYYQVFAVPLSKTYLEFFIISLNIIFWRGFHCIKVQ